MIRHEARERSTPNLNESKPTIKPQQKQIPSGSVNSDLLDNKDFTIINHPTISQIY